MFFLTQLLVPVVPNSMKKPSKKITFFRVSSSNVLNLADQWPEWHEWLTVTWLTQKIREFFQHFLRLISSCQLTHIERINFAIDCWKIWMWLVRHTRNRKVTWHTEHNILNFLPHKKVGLLFPNSLYLQSIVLCKKVGSRCLQYAIYQWEAPLHDMYTSIHFVYIHPIAPGILLQRWKIEMQQNGKLKTWPLPCVQRSTRQSL